jgi:nicotinamidase-related amidase
MTPAPAAAAAFPRIDPARATLLVVDVQERLVAAMDPQGFAACERNILILVELARRLRLPIVQSEQVPGKLGPTVGTIAAAIAATQPGLPVHRLEKETFAVTDHPEFPALFARVDRPQWLVVGLEAHICVFQTARGLRALDAEVFLPADATLARVPGNHRVGLDLAGRCGAVVTSTETVAFDALGRAGTDDFRAISRLVR